MVGGYNSDCTRTFATGDLPDDLAEMYDVCLRAQLAGLEKMRAGTTGAEADAAARAHCQRGRLPQSPGPAGRKLSQKLKTHKGILFAWLHLQSLKRENAW